MKNKPKTPPLKPAKEKIVAFEPEHASTKDEAPEPKPSLVKRDVNDQSRASISSIDQISELSDPVAKSGSKKDLIKSLISNNLQKKVNNT
jgi:hypothetical protein